MLLDTRNQSINKEGFNPSVQNEIITPTVTTKQKVGYVFASIFSFGIMNACMVSRKNWFNRMQMKANQATSGIEIQLAQRRDTLIKLIDATKQSMKYEENLLKDVVKLRGMKIEQSNAVDAANQIEKALKNVYAVIENYPDIQSTKTIRDLMDAADYQEREISAARRLYNSVANEFNSQLFVWPSIHQAAKLKLHTLPLFEATAVQKQDVEIKLM